MVRTIKLNDGKTIPALAWGNGTGGIEHSGQKAIDMGAVSLKAGILHIDTAQIYGTEKEAGQAITAAGMDRKDVWVTTKLSEASKVQTNHDDIRRSVKESIDKIGFVPDMILIHTPFVPEKGKLVEFWQGLEALVEDGTLKGCSIGVSNYRPQDLEELLKVAKIKPAVNQMEYHPYVLNHLDPVMAIQSKHNIVTQAYGPLTPVIRHPTGGPLVPVLEKIADRLSKSTDKKVDAAGVLLQWTIQKGVVAVTTSGNPSNIRKMADGETFGEAGELTDEEMKEIEEVGRKIHYRSYKEHMTKEFPEPDLPEDL